MTAMLETLLGNTVTAAALAVVKAAALVAVAGLTKFTSLVFAPAFVVAVIFEPSLDRKARMKAAVALTGAIAFATAVLSGIFGKETRDLNQKVS